MSPLPRSASLPEVFKIHKKNVKTRKGRTDASKDERKRSPVGEYLKSCKAKPPRCDHSTYYFHGDVFPDPFRPLESVSQFMEDQTSEGYFWIKHQKFLLQKFIGFREGGADTLALKKSFRSAFSGLSAIPGYFSPVKGYTLLRPPITGPSRKREAKIRVGLSIFKVLPDDQNNFRLDKECLLTKQKTTLFNEKDFFTQNDQVKIKSVWIHPHGKFALIYFFSQNHAFFKPESKFCIRLVDTESGKTLEETDTATYDFFFEAWHPTANTYYYTKSSKSPYLKDLYAHEIGDFLEKDAVVVENYSSEHSSLDTYWRFEEMALSGRHLVLSKYNKHMGIPLRQYLTDVRFPERLVEIPVYLSHNYPDFFGFNDQTLYAAKSLDFRKKQILKFSLKNYRAGEKQVVVSTLELVGSSAPILINNHIITVEVSRLEHVIRAYNPEGHMVFEYKPNNSSSLEIVSVDYEGLTIDVRINNYLHPYELIRLDVRDFRTTPLVKKRSLKDTRDLVVSREMALSADGTPVPMTLIHRKDTPLDGTAPTILWGYGGFGLCSVPAYDPFISVWLQSGGIYAVAHVRGDGGWEPGWAEGGSGRLKPNTFKDYISCAEHLIKSGKTSSRKLIAMGASNGGLTVVASMQKRPDLFACVISQIPVLDILNMCIGQDYYRCTAWGKDYGNPMVPEDLKVISGYSPLQNIDKDTIYPPCLVMTAGEDATAHPAHALKFVAAMQEVTPQSPCLLFWKDKGGHDDLFRNESGGTDYDAYGVMFSFIEAALKGQ
jgi:prolyl oligopeptidase